jgi:hypothetical protein
LLIASFFKIKIVLLEVNRQTMEKLIKLNDITEKKVFSIKEEVAVLNKEKLTSYSETHLRSLVLKIEKAESRIAAYQDTLDEIAVISGRKLNS